MGPRARIVNGWCVAATIAIGQCMAMWSSFNLSCMGGQRRGGLQKWCGDFFSMKNMYCENLSEKRRKARRGTTAIIISTGWCFAEKLFPSSWQTRHPHPNKDSYCLTPFSLKHLGIFVTKSWFLHSGPLPVINVVITWLLTPVTHFKKSIYGGYKSIHIGGRGPSCETCLLPNILQRILWWISCILFLQIGISGNGSWDPMNQKNGILSKLVRLIISKVNPILNSLTWYFMKLVDGFFHFFPQQEGNLTQERWPQGVIKLLILGGIKQCKNLW